MNPQMHLAVNALIVIASFYFGVLIGVIGMCLIMVSKRKDSAKVIDITHVANEGIMDECF